MMDYLGQFYVGASGNTVIAYGPPYSSGLTLVVNSSKNGAAFAAITPAVTDIGSGYYTIALSATDTNTLGDLALYVTSAGNDPYYAKGSVIGSNPFATTGPAVNVTSWAGAPTSTTQSAIATTPAVNAIQWAGFSTATTQQAVSTTAGVSATNVNVISWAGFNTATTQLAISTTSVSSATNVNVVSWAGFNTATTQIAIATGPISVNAIQWAGASTATTQLALSTFVNVTQWAGFAAATTQLAVATTAPLATTGLDAIWAYVVDGTVTAAQSLRLNNSAAGGLLSGASGTNVLIRDLANTKNRVDATVDQYGNRSAITRDLT